MSDYPLVPLASLTRTFSDGDWIESKDQSEDGIRLVQTGNVGEGEFRDKAERARFIDEDTFSRLGCTEIREGDVLISRLPDPVGRACLLPALDRRAITAVDCTIVRFDETRVLPRFFIYYSQSSAYLNDVDRKCTGATRRRISRSKLAGVAIPLPSLAEQKHIVAILDETFEGIAQGAANAERNLANARELFECELHSVFENQTGVERTLAEICEIESKLVDPREEEFSDLVHVGGGNMVTQSNELVDLKTAKEEGLISGKFLFSRDTVLYSKIRPYLMKVSRPDFSGLCSADVYPLRPKQGALDRDFLFFMLLSKRFTHYAIQGSDRAGMPKVNRNHLFGYRVRVPDLAVQRKAAERMDRVLSARDQLIALYSAKLDSLAELRRALLHRVFSGQLTGKQTVAA